MLVAVPVLGSGYGCIDATIVATRRNLQLLLNIKIGECLSRSSDVVLQYLSAKVDKWIRIGLPGTIVASLSGDRMLNVNLDDPYAVELPVSGVAQLINAIGLTTGDGKEVRGGEAMLDRVLVKLLIESRVP